MHVPKILGVTVKRSTRAIYFFLSLVALVNNGCTTPNQKHAGAPYEQKPAVTIADDLREPAAEKKKGDRGNPAEYDAGPPKNSKWPDLFAETPNYRAYGKAVYQKAAAEAGIYDDGQEKFRWKVGPMWYRGRLAPNSVKVFVIGQEGAQDENASNRTFTGSTGTKMQNFINYFGIDTSYLFMNTFTYTITGQYGERPEPTDTPKVKKQKEIMSNTLFWIAQNPNSEIVKHRHRMFDYMLSQNKNTLSLIIGVGAAGKDSLATWINSHGGRCNVRMLSQTFCDASVIKPGAKAIGVMHPGAASAKNGGSNAAASLQEQFAARAAIVTKFIEEDPNFLKPDKKADFSIPYRYMDAVIPHRDFSFGSSWRLGQDGTASNRRGADGIQVYSSQGCYNNALRDPQTNRCNSQPGAPSLPVQYDEPTDLASKFEMAPGDVPYESPKSPKDRRDYDDGPGAFAPVLMGQSNVMGLNHSEWPDFMSLGVTADKSFGHGSIYRGNFKKPELLILADQESNDDMFSARALTGTGGQRLQTLLNALGMRHKYVIIRTLPVDTLDLSIEKATEIAMNPAVTAVRNNILKTILEQKKTRLILTVGPVAAEAIKTLDTKLKIITLAHPLADNHVTQWQQAIGQVFGAATASKYDGTLTAIPRYDLPIHTRWWMGTSGTRSARAWLYGQNGHKVWNGDYYKFEAPSWVNTINYPADPKKLSAQEASSLKLFSLNPEAKIAFDQEAANEPATITTDKVQ